MFTIGGKRIHQLSESELSGGPDAAKAGGGAPNTYYGDSLKNGSIDGAVFVAAAASDYLIAGNDEHGMDPPTYGKRTPVLPYLGYPFYENQFNSEAKKYFLTACRRIGFRTFDVKPGARDMSINERVTRINNAKPDVVITFAYNAFGDGAFNPVSGVECLYSSSNAYASKSLALANAFYQQLLKGTPQRGRGVYANNTIGVLANVRMPSALGECGFMTSFTEPKFMLDPDFQMECGEAGCAAVCSFFGIIYTPAYPNHNRPTLRRGSRGNDVKYLQSKLTTKLYPAGAIDGIFGQKTEAAVKQFQIENTLAADGIVGKKTWAKLYPIGGGRVITN